MNLPVSKGENYSLLALDAGTDVREVVDLGHGYLALPLGGFGLPAHWKEWLGTMRTEAIERATLVLMAKAASFSAGVLGDESQRLQLRLGNLYWGLLASGRVRVEGAGTQLTGGYDADGISVRQVGDVDHIITCTDCGPTV
jgi:hypothetical protein